MKVVNKCELKLEKYEKCSLICDCDCPLGQLYDYACCLISFVKDKMKAAEEACKPASDPEPVDQPTEQ